MSLPKKSVFHVGLEVFASQSPENHPLAIFMKEVNDRGFLLGPTETESAHWHHGTNRICMNIIEFFYLADKFGIPTEHDMREFEAMVGIIGLHELGHAVTTVKIIEEGERMFGAEAANLSVFDGEFLVHATELGAWAWAETMLKDETYRHVFEKVKSHGLETHVAFGRRVTAKAMMN